MLNSWRFKGLHEVPWVIHGVHWEPIFHLFSYYCCCYFPYYCCCCCWKIVLLQLLSLLLIWSFQFSFNSLSPGSTQLDCTLQWVIIKYLVWKKSKMHWTNKNTEIKIKSLNINYWLVSVILAILILLRAWTI